MNTCYFCARELTRGHWPLCPVLDMSRARRETFFGVVAGMKHAATPLESEDTLPALRPSGYMQGSRLV